MDNNLCINFLLAFPGMVGYFQKVESMIKEHEIKTPVDFDFFHFPLQYITYTS